MLHVPTHFGSRDVEAILGKFLGISEEGSKAFAGRMKHLIRQKFPDGVDTGRGVPARYYADQFFQVVVVVELWQWGVPPARATRMVTEAWPVLRKSVRTVWRAVEWAERNNKPEIEVEPIFWRVPVEALAYLTRERRPWRGPDADKLLVLTTEEREAVEQEMDGRDWRVAYIEAHKMLELLFRYLKLGELMPFEKVTSLMNTFPPMLDDERAT
ncbi:hypothetical protein [Polymorphobacter megasporae]|uniref:hypothetical protein n=1 Tax=Glacieibacterium megasporae TaxID=2835787 RepID=UPI001C1E6EB9|nr:hypothetical protein [Polymorphobacter megasporae]UAJ10044.1 hypothetical protein KTC28_17495 [Polymorphobacter megasporae]